MSWIDDLFGGGRETAGNDIYNQMMQAWQQAQGMMNPYVNRGNNAYDAYIKALNQGENPMDLYNQFAASYKESPEALAQTQAGEQAANRANAASGMLGSGAAQKQAASEAEAIRSQDFDKYMQNLYNTRTEYLGGQGGLEKQGMDASTNLSGMLTKLFEDMAQGKAGAAEGKAQGDTGLLNAGLGLAGDIFGGGFGGGIGAWLSNLFNGGGGRSSNWEDPNLQQPF